MRILSGARRLIRPLTTKCRLRLSEESFPQQEKAQEEKPAEKDPASAILESLGISDEEEKQEIDEFEVIRKIFDR